MIELAALKDVLDLGATGILLFFVVILYRRVVVLTDRLFAYLEKQDSDEKAREE